MTVVVKSIYINAICTGHSLHILHLLIPHCTIERKHTMSATKAGSKSEMYLDELEVGVTGTIIVMVCRVWDVNAATGRYLSTDFVISDAKVRPA